MAQMRFKEFLKSSGAKEYPQIFFNYFYRKISFPVSYLFLVLGMSPNRISVLSIIFAIAGGIVVFEKKIFAGLIIFMLSFLLDHCDGNVARAWDKLGIARSPANRQKGGLLECLNTNISLFTFFTSLGYYLFVVFNRVEYLLIAFTVFGARMIARSYVTQEYLAFKGDYENESDKWSFSENYKKSFFSRLKFFLKEHLFSSTFCYVIYLVAFLLTPKLVVPVFLAYSFADIGMSAVRLIRVMIRKH